MKRFLEISLGIFLVLVGIYLWWQNGGGFDFGLSIIILIMFVAGGAALLLEGVDAPRRYALPILIAVAVLALLFVFQPPFFIDFIVKIFG